MAIKYQIEYDDLVNVKHVFEIYDDNYTGDPVPVDGSVTMDYGQVDENLESFRGQGLRVDLDADSTLTYEDLFSSQQKVFSVIYYRDSTVLFQGWLNSEGFFEDFVNDKWIVSFDCIDGLGYLENLAFVNSDGTNITGVKTQLEILSLALQRTGIQANINVDIDVFYTGLADTNSILENVKANTRRYIKDDDVTVMNCEEVIRDVLEAYGAVLTSYNGQWAIYKPNQLVSNQTATFFRYDYLGVALSPATVTFEFGLTLGSQINGFNPHHCNGNQSFTNKPSFGAYRISYKYGLIKSLIENDRLYTADGSTYDGFTIVNTTYFVPALPDSYGMTFINSTSILNFKTDNITIPENSALTVSLGAVSDYNNALGDMINYVIVDDGTDYYAWDRYNNVWIKNSYPIFASIVFSFYSDGSEYISDAVIPTAPVGGELRIEFWNIRGGNPATITKVSISTDSGANSDIDGEIFTFEREDNPSARIEKTREVFTGDSNLDIYTGTLYKSDGTTPTETWYRKGITEAVPILKLMGSETMRMNANTMRVFSGDVFGYLNYLSVITIDGRSGKFGVTKYSYDTKNNIISLEAKQMFADELTDLEVEKTFDYGNVVEPTIRG